MAIRLEDEYTNAIAADASYPEGSFKNETSPGALDGTPYERKWPNDIIGFLQKLLDVASITPSGSPDTVLASDYYDALLEVIDQQRGVFANHVNGYPVIDDDDLYISNVIADSDWDSVGPTGSGADYEWPALDILPTGVKWVELSIYGTASGTPGSSGFERIEAWAIENGGTQTASGYSQIFTLTYRYFNGEFNLYRDLMLRKIPVDSNGMFEIMWSQDATQVLSASLFAYLTGYGFK